MTSESTKETRRALRSAVKPFLKWAGMAPAARAARSTINFLTDPTFRRNEIERRRLERVVRKDYLELQRTCGDSLQSHINGGRNPQSKALVVGTGILQLVKVEMALIKGLELAGYEPVVLTRRNPWLVKYYRLAGVEEIFSWGDFNCLVEPAEADALAGGLQSFEDLVALEYAAARVGKYAASTALRYLRVGSLDPRSPEIRSKLLPYLASAMGYATASKRIVREVRPHIALSMDPGYSPRGELYDACLADGIDTLTWNAAHKSNALLLKRYRNVNRDLHPASLSQESWDRIQKMRWAGDHRERLYEEIRSNYASGDWYSEVGTQFNTRILETSELTQRLSLDTSRKTAVIFPHIFWDGTFFWGTDLFESYEQWFLETVKAACANDRINWIIKVHPGNVVKNVRDGVHEDPAEVTAIRESIGPLPPHIRLIPADSDINTFSLFELMDYCVTVRGTVGIEAAIFGKPVLTAGTGRYDHKGFTIDSETREEFLQKLAHIQDIPVLTPEQQELAQRFAYGLFVLRPLPLKTVTLEYAKDAKASSKTRFNVRNKEDLLNAPDLRAFADWVTSGREDFMALDSEVMA